MRENTEILTYIINALLKYQYINFNARIQMITQRTYVLTITPLYTNI